MKYWKQITVSVIFIVCMAIVFFVSRDITEQKYNVEVDATNQEVLDSMFNDMVNRLDSFKVIREVQYNNTKTIYKKTINSYEKVNNVVPITDRDSLLESLTRISNTPG